MNMQEKYPMRSKNQDKAMLSLFYGQRVLRQAKIVPDKKKS